MPYNGLQKHGYVQLLTLHIISKLTTVLISSSKKGRKKNHYSSMLSVKLMKTVQLDVVAVLILQD